MHAEIAKRRDEIAAICRRFRVSRLEVFGSAARGNDFDPKTSDADFLVEYHPDNDVSLIGHIRLAHALGDMLGRKVDLAQPGAIRNKYLKEAIDRSREIVYGA